MTKVLLVMRHGNKTNPTDVQKALGITAEQITPAGFNEAKEVGHALHAKYDITDIFHSPELRTAQTLLGLMAGGIGAGATIHGVINGLFNPAMFDKFDMDKFKAALKAGAKNYGAMLQATTPENLDALRQEIGAAITEMFDKMIGDMGLAVSHDPIITLGAEYHGWENPHSLEPLGYLVFQQAEDGTISVIADG